ncbi:CaiB/BaiF CoA transferase family protein [Marinivivus vitaminiproducens]|uniref:CaiB/BaiF CoA transferase family protein n=1 Tax=Marinivivus vitaminiproducens TaxID=3035935 RepID=UPI002798EA9A|nr:CoA transferase [Geminicoccaceae bacterium SCSIO 64248]
MAAALAGITAIDLSESIGGQYCGRLLADYGADVILIEPEGGSVTRAMPPLSARTDRQESLLFAHLNAGKRTATLRSPALLEDWLRAADVAVLPPGLDPQTIAAINPRCVTATVSPFGQDGPWSHWEGPEIVIQALSGMMHNNGIDGREPLYGCGHRASFAAGLGAYIGVLAALHARHGDNLGQAVTVEAAETAAAMCFPYVLQHIYNGTVKSRSDMNIPAGQVRCRDGWVCIWIYNHRWRAVCATLGLAHLENDERFAEPLVRRRNWAALFAIIQSKLADADAEQVVAELQAAQVIAAKAYRPSELYRSAHLVQRGFWEASGLEEGPVRLGPPFRMSATPRVTRSDVPVSEPAHPLPAGLPAKAEAVAQAAGTQPRAPLAGLRVVELTTAWAGPMAGRVLAYLGAECIHIESPNRVNSWRLNKETPNPINFPDGVPGGRPFDRAFHFNSQNVNKRSCILNLKQERGRQILRRLVAVSDVVVCNFRPGTLAKLGLAYDDLRAIKPDIIVAEMPAYGLTGPMSGYAALGPTMEMATGMASMIGYADGQPETTGPSYLDPIGGFNAAAAILTALVHRQKAGEGQHVEIAQVEAAMQFIGAELLAAIETGQDPARAGNRSPYAAPHDAFPARGSDQWVAIAARTQEEWSALCTAIGRPGLAGDPRFASLEARLANQDALGALLSAWTSMQDKHAIAEALQMAGVPAAPVQTPADVAAWSYLIERGFFTELDHAEAGRHRYPSLPIRLSRTPGGQHRAAPPFGADNLHVLSDILGLDAETIAEVQASGVMTFEPLPGA